MNETAKIEQYLQKTLPAEERLLIEAQLILDPELQQKTFWQEQAYGLIKQHGRAALKAEIERVATKMFTDKKYSAFRKQINKIFNNNL